MRRGKRGNPSFGATRSGAAGSKTILIECATNRQHGEAFFGLNVRAREFRPDFLTYPPLSRTPKNKIVRSFVVVDDTPCGNVILDTGFTGLASDGCAESAPCCVGGAGCTGVAGGVCPAFPGAVPAPGGGIGAGSGTFVPKTGRVYVVSFGVCDNTGK